MAPTRPFALLLVTALLCALPAFAEDPAAIARDDEIAALRRQVEVLADELSRVRTQLAVPEQEELKGEYGYGPAASKIYGLERGLSIGGYGEFNYRHFVSDKTVNDRDRADMLRLVTYLGYKFNESIAFNSEIEFEHGIIGEDTVSASSGEVAIEFASLDFFWKPQVNFRAGLLLLPMGFINEVHEPPFFYGVSRPETERRILPATWREMGAGIFGKIGETLEYRTYVVTGFNATGFDDEGIREGRQGGDRSLAEDVAFVTRLDWTPDAAPGLLLGGSFYVGNSGQDLEVQNGRFDVPDSGLWIAEGHAQYRNGPFSGRALFAMSQLSDAGHLSAILQRPQGEPIADTMLGGYAEAAWDLWPTLFGDGEKSLAPFVRVEYVDTQYDVPTAFTPNRNEAWWVVTPGIQFHPHPNVVLKLEYRNFTARAGSHPDEVAMGMGFAF